MSCHREEPKDCFDKAGIITGLLTEPYPFRWHQNKIRLYNRELSCGQCNRGTETAQYVLSECETLDHKRKPIYYQPKLTVEDDLDPVRTCTN